MIHGQFDATVIGGGPNGLSAAIVLAQEGFSVTVLEARETVGGGCRSAALTLPGFIHDVCSAVHPLGFGSPFFRTLPLAQHGLRWVSPPVAVAHPLCDGRAVLLHSSLPTTSAGLGVDGEPYMRLFRPLVERWDELCPELLAPLHIPRHPITMGRFGIRGLQSAVSLAHSVFRTEEARALFGGLCAHSMLPLERNATAAFGLLLGALGHASGWPFPFGGSQRLMDALVSHLTGLGGTISTDHRVETFADIPVARALLFDVTPRQFLGIAGFCLRDGYRKRLEQYRYGQGVFKIDWALREPIPFAAEECRLAGTVHLGGTFGEIAAAERAVWSGQHPERPFVLLAQPSLFDASRAPAGNHIAWAYCHVPRGSTNDMTHAIEAQVERFAPGFGDCILARYTMNCRELETYNPNYIGGDINGGVQDLGQIFARPVFRFMPYTTPLKGVYLCSSSTPPGGGVHGMCGYHAAQSALQISLSRGN